MPSPRVPSDAGTHAVDSGVAVLHDVRLPDRRGEVPARGVRRQRREDHDRPGRHRDVDRVGVVAPALEADRRLAVLEGARPMHARHDRDAPVLERWRR